MSFRSDVTETASAHKEVKDAHRTFGSQPYHQHELLMKGIDLHNWDASGGGMGTGGRRDLRGKSFFVHFAEDGLSVKVVEE